MSDVGEKTYGTAPGVSRYVGYMPGTERHFTDATVPSLASVNDILDQVAAEIHLELAVNGYQIDTAATVLADAPMAHAFLAQCNNLGAAARVLMTMPLEADPDSEIRPNFSKIYKDQLAKIEGGGLEALLLVRPSTTSGNLRMSNTGQKDAAGTDKKSLFWLGQFMPPGLRIEEETRYYNQ